MDNHGDSVSVTKRCVSMEECLLTGCVDVTYNDYQVGGALAFSCIYILFLLNSSFHPPGVLVLLRGEHL